MQQLPFLSLFALNQSLLGFKCVLSIFTAVQTWLLFLSCQIKTRQKQFFPQEQTQSEEVGVNRIFIKIKEIQDK